MNSWRIDKCIDKLIDVDPKRMWETNNDEFNWSIVQWFNKGKLELGTS